MSAMIPVLLKRISAVMINGGNMFLELKDLRAGYGQVEVLHGVSLHVNKGEIVSILGANGAGKTTTMHTISGLATIMSGSIRLADEEISKLPSHEIVTRGLTQSPEGRRVFNSLTVLENLKLGAFTIENKKLINESLDWIYGLFPRLYERRSQMAGTLSGGEQQMLAIGRALMGQPEILLLDEPSLGLAPLLVKAIFETVKKVNENGVTILIVEQNAKAALKIATRGYVMEMGRIVIQACRKRIWGIDINLPIWAINLPFFKKVGLLLWLFHKEHDRYDYMENSRGSRRYIHLPVKDKGFAARINLIGAVRKRQIKNKKQ